MSEFDEKPGQPLPTPALPLMSSVVVGWLDASSAPARLLVDFPGNTFRGPRLARTTIVLTDTALMQAIAARQGALLVFENADPALPILIGLLQTPEASLLGALLQPVLQPALQPARAPGELAAAVGGPVPAEAAASPAVPVRTAQSARLDGDSVALEGQREVVLRCGEASLTLRRDGKVLIRGAYVETLAKGVNRIKGGAVKIN